MSSVERLATAIVQASESLPVDEAYTAAAQVGEVAALIQDVSGGEVPRLDEIAATLQDGQEHLLRVGAALVSAGEHFEGYLEAICATEGTGAGDISATVAPLGNPTGSTGVAAEMVGTASQLDREYEDMKAAEAVEARPEDLLRVGTIYSEQPEYEVLIAAGVSREDLESGYVARGVLQDLGYFFFNRLGNGEKFVLSGDFPDPNNPGQMLNYAGKTFLTREELQAAYDYQQQHPEEYGLQGEDLDAVRKDMLLFMHSAVARPAFVYESDFWHTCIPHEPDHSFFIYKEGDTVSEDDWKFVDKYFEAKIKEYRRTHDDGYIGYRAQHRVQAQFVTDYCADLFTRRDDIDPFGTRAVRGFGVQSIEGRSRKMKDQPSPFLESGWTFAGNLDASVYFGQTDIRADNQYRINTATLHLLGGHPDFPGLTEMGGRKEQIYMTPGVYINNLYPRTDAARAAVEQEKVELARPSRRGIIYEAQRRIIAIAKEYDTERRANRPWWRGGPRS